MIPHISDKGRRMLRTALQVAAAFLSFAAVYPALVTAIGAPTGSRVAEWLATAGLWITAGAAIITRLMAVPAVDQVLTLLGVGSIPRSHVQVALKAPAAAAELLNEEVAETAVALEHDPQPALAAPGPEPEEPVDHVAAIQAQLRPDEPLTHL